MTRYRVLLVDDETVPSETGPCGGYMWYYSQAMHNNDFTVRRCQVQTRHWRSSDRILASIYRHRRYDATWQGVSNENAEDG